MRKKALRVSRLISRNPTTVQNERSTHTERERERDTNKRHSRIKNGIKAMSSSLLLVANVLRRAENIIYANRLDDFARSSHRNCCCFFGLGRKKANF